MLLIWLLYYLTNRMFLSLFHVSRAGGSMDTEMDRVHLYGGTPCSKTTPSSKRFGLGSLERSMDRIKDMLTPRKKPCATDKPRVVKAAQNICCTSRRHYDEVLIALKQAIVKHNINHKQVGLVNSFG